MTSSSESDDYTCTRPRRRRTPNSHRSDGSSSTQATTHVHTEESAPPVHQHHDSIPLAVDTKSCDTLAPSRPPRGDPPSQGLRGIGSDVSLSATPPSPALTPITSALTQGNIGSTNDEDMSDFQNASSVSPRDSHGKDNAQQNERDSTPTPIETTTGSLVGEPGMPINRKSQQTAYGNAATVDVPPMDSATTANCRHGTTRLIHLRLNLTGSNSQTDGILSFLFASSAFPRYCYLYSGSALAW